MGVLDVWQVTKAICSEDTTYQRSGLRRCQGSSRIQAGFIQWGGLSLFSDVVATKTRSNGRKWVPWLKNTRIMALSPMKTPGLRADADSGLSAEGALLAAEAQFPMAKW